MNKLELTEALREATGLTKQEAQHEVRNEKYKQNFS